MEIGFLTLIGVGIVAVVVWLIRQGPPDDGLGPPPGGDSAGSMLGHG
jgi:hypothetical protein